MHSMYASNHDHTEKGRRTGDAWLRRQATCEDKADDLDGWRRRLYTSDDPNDLAEPLVVYEQKVLREQREGVERMSAEHEEERGRTLEKLSLLRADDGLPRSLELEERVKAVNAAVDEAAREIRRQLELRTSQENGAAQSPGIKATEDLGKTDGSSVQRL
jgi:hypothetical protein